MRLLLVLFTLTLLGCQSEKKIEDIHFGPGPGDMEEEAINDC
ncbi:MAG: hypothetical protein K1000chlam3_01653 [Chlamydiae bacterium]|nr:hypothetical protein [Chlamydiota bacterium]